MLSALQGLPTRAVEAKAPSCSTSDITGKGTTSHPLFKIGEASRRQEARLNVVAARLLARND